ncbi:hypothetical protein ACRRTK_024129 [Alexandromys fortis]
MSYRQRSCRSIQLADGPFMFKPPDHQMLLGERISPNQWNPPTGLCRLEHADSMLFKIPCLLAWQAGSIHDK